MVYVMSDIHGNLPRFRSIMHQIDLQESDHLYVLGDVIDRFPDGLSILKELTLMPNCTVLLGNHEMLLYDAVSCPQDAFSHNVWIWNGGKVTHTDFLRHSNTEQAQILRFIEEMPISQSVTVNNQNFLLVHGAPPELYNPNDREFYSKGEYVIWHRLLPEEKIKDDKIVIFGHTPTAHYQNSKPFKIWYGENRIEIDCGSGSYEGRLACLRLDDMKEFYSEE